MKEYAPLPRHSVDLEFAHCGNNLGKETQMQLLGNLFVGCHHPAVSNAHYMCLFRPETPTIHCGHRQPFECLGMHLASPD